MKLRKLSSVGHNAAASYMSTISHIGQSYTTTFIYRLALKRGLATVELDVLNASSEPSFDNADLRASLLELKVKFLGLLERESLPAEAVTSYKLSMQLLGSMRDVVDLQCTPTITDLNGKLYNCAAVREKYPAPITGNWP
ncbi:MAG TPA: hypothetical protein PK760_02790 [Flavobacteriales bacterium]|nr:hypothetical protein [Flavobacteriales bacterium]